VNFVAVNLFAGVSMWDSKPAKAGFVIFVAVNSFAGVSAVNSFAGVSANKKGCPVRDSPFDG
jgi:hypothetical protein